MNVIDIEISKIHPDPDQPRQFFDEAKLHELATSIQAHGVRVPIEVRPHPNAKKAEAGYFMLNVGERRWRAAEIAGLTTIPAIVETDKVKPGEVLELQLIENSQRADITALEEGETYRKLKEGYGHTIETLMERTGKGHSHVYARIQLTKLPASVKKSITEGKLPPAIASLVATVDPKLQEQYANECMGKSTTDLEDHGILPEAVSQDGSRVIFSDTDSLPLSYRAAKELLRRKYSTRLSLAKFDTTDPELTKAGACGPCPHRSGAQLELGVKGAGVATDDVCVKPSCFEEKTHAAWKKIAEAAKLTGVEVISEKVSKDMFHGADLRPGTPYVDLNDDVPYELLATPGKPPTWGKLLGKKAGDVPRVLAKDGTGAARDLLDRAEAVKILREAGKLENPKAPKKTTASTSSSSPGQSKKEAAERAIRAETAMRVLDAIGEKGAGDADAKRELAWFRWMGRAVLRTLDLAGSEAVYEYLEHVGCETYEDYIKKIDTAKSAREVRGLIIAALAAEHAAGRIFGWVGERHNDVMDEALKLFGVSWDKCEDAARLAVEHEQASLAASQEAAKLTDKCGKCGLEMGEHDGKKCPPKKKAGAK